MSAIVEICNRGYDTLEHVEIWTRFPQKEWGVTMTISNKIVFTVCLMSCRLT